KGTGCKPVGSAYGGSNPPAPTLSGLQVRPGPGVRQQVALRERVARVDDHLRDTRDPGAATDRGDDRRATADRRLRDDAALERRPEHGRVRHRVADAQVAARVERRHARGETGAGRGAVEPPGRDDDGIFRGLADALPRLGDLDDADAGDLRVLGMRAGELLARGRADLLADERELARLGGLDREAERVRVGNRVPHAAEGDVDGYCTEAVHVELRVETVGEARDVRQ